MKLPTPTEIIPHRPPFLFLDEVSEVSLSDPVRAKGFWTPKSDLDVFEGHFPGRPTLPGVLMIESLAQLGAYLLLMKEEYKGLLPLFGGIDRARFRKQVVPDTKLELEIQLISLSSRSGKGSGVVLAEGKKACEMDLLFVLVQDTQT